MIDDDKPRRHQRWLMVLESVKGAEHPKLDNLESWHTTLKAVGVPSKVLIGTKSKRTKAIDLTLQDSKHVALYEWEGISVRYHMKRES
ncbi:MULTISPECIES: hypothetical protein [Rahnella]|uniref:Uncharacterized protein n=1 Tax=Rahnella victoriana TaxID=1510570 RepID=A0ABS0DQE4_9GAMM|nr:MULTISPECIES: hypothetical protein [Rahnella]MBF7956101.1 hypothetical protein [Rahnella victoriana]TBX35802.1 hypothetical protein EYY67_06650 [Rahnella victoriana]